MIHITMEDDYSFSLLKKRNIFSNHFQYSERTKATTETNNTSKESSKVAKRHRCGIIREAPRLSAIKSLLRFLQ